MSKISRITGLNNISNLYSFLGTLDTALISCTLSDDIVRISIDNNTAIITMGYSGSWVRPITVTYNGYTDTWGNPSHIFTPDVICCYAGDYFYLKFYNTFTEDNNNKGAIFSYRRIPDGHIFGYIGNTNEYTIHELIYIDANGVQYNYIKPYNYSFSSADTIEYTNGGFLCKGSTIYMKDPYFISCTPLTSANNIITFGGNNYYALGTSLITLLE